MSLQDPCCSEEVVLMAAYVFGVLCTVGTAVCTVGTAAGGARSSSSPDCDVESSWRHRLESVPRVEVRYLTEVFSVHCQYLVTDAQAAQLTHIT